MTSRGTIYVRNPLPDPISELSVCLRTSAPLRDLSILRDQSPRPDLERIKLTLAGCPIFLRSPPRGNNLIITQRFGSSVQIRYFLPGSLSFEPLGTTVMMSLIVRSVNREKRLSSRNKWLIMFDLECPAEWTACE